MKMRHLFPLLVGMAALALPVAAQDYEDDIYYNADKARKSTPKPVQKSRPAYITGNAGQSADYPAADTYTPAPGAGLDMDVDAYNRHTPTASDTLAAANDDADFTYTRRIERFHNPEIVSGSGDEELEEYYYATEQPATINVNVINVDPWDWWGPSWSWRYNAWYSPFWSPYSYGWGPSWSWRWNWGWGGWYDPYWSWAGAWGPSWGWVPSWGCGPALPPPGHRPGWGNHAWRPSSPGSHTGRRYTSGSGMATTTGRRPGYNGSHASAARPGSGNTGIYRPGAGTRPGNTGIGGITTSTGRGRYGSARPGTVLGDRRASVGSRDIQSTRRVSGSRSINSARNASADRSIYNSNRSSSSTRSSGSYNSSRSSSPTRSSGSFNSGRSSYGGGHSGGGYSGGGHSGGGGGSRGRH